MAVVVFPDRSNRIVIPDNKLQEYLARGYITNDDYCAEQSQSAAQNMKHRLSLQETESERYQMLRQNRDMRIAATDYLLFSDYPIDEKKRAEIIAYRQALRDLPAQEGAPWDGGGELTPWPEMPA